MQVIIQVYDNDDNNSFYSTINNSDDDADADGEDGDGDASNDADSK